MRRQTIPDIAKELDDARKARDAWLKSKRWRLALKAVGVEWVILDPVGTQKG